MKIKVRDSETGAPQILDLHRNTITMRDESSGRMIEMDLGMPDVHLDRALASYAAGYRFIDFECIADDVAPVTLTPFASDKFFNWDKDDILQDADDIIVGPGGTVKEITPRLSSAAFQTVSYGIGCFVPTELQSNADSPLSLQQAATARCMTVLKQARERRVAALTTTPGNWTGGYSVTLGATAKWNGGSASAPVQDVFALQEGSLSPIRTLVMPEPVYHGYAANTNVQKFFVSKNNTPPLAGDATNGAQAQALADLLGVNQVKVLRLHLGNQRRRRLQRAEHPDQWSGHLHRSHVPLERRERQCAGRHDGRWHDGPHLPRSVAWRAWRSKGRGRAQRRRSDDLRVLRRPDHRRLAVIW
jgi:hypothetical protein